VDSLNATHEIIQERLKESLTWRLSQLSLTFPTTPYQKEPNTILIVNNPSDLPEPSRLDHVEEPFIKVIITKSDYVNVMSLCIETWIDY
jgi:GTP-binding protein LepA